MSGFSAEWLALREPADHRARNVEMRETVRAFLGDRASVSIVDLGCGTGSNLRGLAPHLSAKQRWRLVDHDPELLAAAREALVAWADESSGDAPVILQKDGRRIEVTFATADLAAHLPDVLTGQIDLVTAAAFFDLVSAGWLAHFTTELAKRHLPLYTILTYSGREIWSPPHEADGAILAAFHGHQGGDKGFGEAAGPLASGLLADGLMREGYRVETAEAPWLLGADDRALIGALCEGIAGAAAQTGKVSAETAATWKMSRREALHCEISHVDLFARPLRSSGAN